MCVPSQQLSISGSVVTPGWLCVQDVKDHFKQAGHVLHADILQVGGWEGVSERASTAVSCKYPLFLTHHSLFADVAPCCDESRRQRKPKVKAGSPFNCRLPAPAHAWPTLCRAGRRGEQ